MIQQDKAVIAKNAKAQKDYSEYLEEAKGFSEKTVRVFERAITIFNQFFTDDYKKLSKEDAILFKEWLKTDYMNDLQPQTRVMMLRQLSSFFEFLSREPGYRRSNLGRVSTYLEPDKADKKIRNHVDSTMYPDLEEAQKVFDAAAKDDTLIGRRDQAIVAMMVFGAVRIDALISLPIAAFDPKKGIVYQINKYGVRTKFDKQIPTVLMKFDSAMYDYLMGYPAILKNIGFKKEDPLFPSVQMVKSGDDLYFSTPTDLSRDFIASQETIRNVLRKRSEEAGIDYYSPHKYRHLAFLLAWRLCDKPEDIKVISQNFGHEKISTMLTEYSNFAPDILIKKASDINNRQGSVGAVDEKLYMQFQQFQKFMEMKGE